MRGTRELNGDKCCLSIVEKVSVHKQGLLFAIIIQANYIESACNSLHLQNTFNCGGRKTHFNPLIGSYSGLGGEGEAFASIVLLYEWDCPRGF